MGHHGNENDSARWAPAGDHDPADHQGSRFRGRLDELLKSALAEQEREQAAFMKVLQSSRDALNQTRMELDALRALVEGRDDAVVALLDGRLAVAAREESVHALTRAVDTAASEQAALKLNLSVKLDSIAGALEAVDFRTRETIAALTERMASLERSLQETVLAVTGELAAAGQREEALLAMLDQRLGGIERIFDTRQQEVADAILKALDPVGRIMQLVQSRLARAASDLAVAQGSLLSRLVERDDRLERQRDQVLADLLNEFAGNLKARDRSRIGEELLEADGRRRRRRDLGRAVPSAGIPEPELPHNGEVDAPAAAWGPVPAANPPVPASGGLRGRRGRKPAL